MRDGSTFHPLANSINSSEEGNKKIVPSVVAADRQFTGLLGCLLIIPSSCLSGWSNCVWHLKEFPVFFFIPHYLIIIFVEVQILINIYIFPPISFNEVFCCQLRLLHQFSLRLLKASLRIILSQLPCPFFLASCHYNKVNVPPLADILYKYISLLVFISRFAQFVVLLSSSLYTLFIVERLRGFSDRILLHPIPDVVTTSFFVLIQVS